MMNASRIMSRKISIGMVAALSAMAVSSSVDKNKSIFLRVAHSEKKDAGAQDKSWGLRIPDMPWAQRLHDADEDYQAQAKLPVEIAVLTAAPNVPPPITRRHPVLLKVNMTTELKTIQLTSRFKYEAWSVKRQSFHFSIICLILLVISQ